MATASERQELLESAEHFLSELSQPVRRRVSALKKLQLNSIEIETEFYRQLHELECQFADRLNPLSVKRTQIVVGEYEPNDDECSFQLKSDEPAKTKENGDANAPTENTEEKGIPEFWLTVFKNNMLTAEMIEEPDEPILAHLRDVTFELSRDPMGFKLFFHFSPNDFFTNTVLTKEYSLKCEADKTYPFDFEGPEIVACKGCTIDWKAGKNVTVKTIKRKQKHKTKGDTRVITQTVRADSFFNFFTPPTITGNSDEMDEETRTLLNADFEIGQIMRDRIIPRAVLYFTGEATDDDDYDDEEDEELEDEDDEDISGEDEEEEKPSARKGGKGGGRH